MAAFAQMTFISLRRHTAAGVAALVSVGMGSVIALSNNAIPVAAALTIVIGGMITFALAAESALIALIATSPIGLEQLTGGDRTLLAGYGGWAVSSVRLGVLLLAGLTVLALRGIPRRLVAAEYAYLALIAWIVATMAFSPDLFAGTRFTAKLAVLLVAWLSFGWVVKRFGEQYMWKLLLATLAGLLLVDFAFIATDTNFHHYADETRRFAGLAGEPASGALSVAALAIPALYLWFRDRNRIALALYLLAWVPILMSVTRIAIFGFAVSTVVLALLMRRRLQATIIVVAIGIVLVSYAPIRERTAFGPDDQSWQTIVSTFRSQGAEGLNTEGRTELWSALSRQYHVHPIEGSGAGASEAVLRSAGSFGGVEQAHSDYMALLVNGGVIALVLWLTALGGLAVHCARRGGSAVPAAAVLTMYLIAAITDNTIEMYAYLGIPVAALVAIALANERRGGTTEDPSDSDRLSISPLGARRRTPELQT